ncbi:protein WVD2-like 7 isoform X1 [Ananas comosus]|uniref:Protein WVD2-like 7 isoform X1 n=1 Tax=Ananas comosus TaxID=4615 RepID=A0A6P5EZF7_ANACO|nr:protein WVD2-like 7 isoform X1 [Ananas comosus]
MAGEVQDCLTYQQADSLHTGSVSFGRFESEPLSWERRSSFSHNKYLEEVEKCSTPGSVVQKKAYFEAHFKKKGLLYPASPGSLYAVGNNATENGSHDHPDHIEDWENDDDGDENHFSHFDETPAVSDEHEEMGGEEEEVISPAMASPSKYSQKQDLCYDKIREDAAIDAQNKNDTVRSQHEIFSIPSDQKAGDESGGIVEESTERRDITSKNTTVSRKKDPGMEKRENSHREKKAVELRSSKVNQWSQIPVTKGSIGPSNVKSSLSSSKLNKTLDKVDGENKVKKESEKQSSLRISLSSNSKNQKAMDSSNAKAKVKPENRRSMHLASSIKAEVKQSTAAFNFRSDERAEKRREFYMKLEEKLHAKEAETNEIQARTQEETEAKIKQLRKSLNFKATPMPSFYHGTTPRIPGAKKMPATARSSSKLQTRSTTSGTKPSPRDKSAAHPELTSKERSSSGEPIVAGKGDGNTKRGERSRVRSSGAGKAMKSIGNGDLAVDVSS